VTKRTLIMQLLSSGDLDDEIVVELPSRELTRWQEHAPRKLWGDVTVSGGVGYSVVTGFTPLKISPDQTPVL
jgi:hypothetical protein